MQISETRVDIGRDQRDRIDIGVRYEFEQRVGEVPAPANDDQEKFDTTVSEAIDLFGESRI